MTRALSSENYAALQANRLIKRDFVWFTVKDRTTGESVTDGYWSDVGSITADVVDPESGGTATRTYAGAAGLISISDIPLVSTLAVQQITIQLAQVSGRVNDLLRTYNCKQGKAEIHCGLFDPVSRELVAPAFPRFVGFIDEAPVTTPKENDNGNVTLTCTSHTQEMNRSNPDTRSDASQKLRSASDDFYKDTAVVGTWPIFWGQAKS